MKPSELLSDRTRICSALLWQQNKRILINLHIVTEPALISRRFLRVVVLVPTQCRLESCASVRPVEAESKAFLLASCSYFYWQNVPNFLFKSDAWCAETTEPSPYSPLCLIHSDLFWHFHHFSSARLFNTYCFPVFKLNTDFRHRLLIKMNATNLLNYIKYKYHLSSQI